MAKTINGNTARRNTMMTMMMMKGRRNVSMGDKCLEPERIVDRQDRQTDARPHGKRRKSKR